MSSVEVAAHVGQEVLMEVDNDCAQIVGNSQRILGKQLTTHPIHLLRIIINLITY